MTTVTGFAVLSFGKINIATVSPTERGAKVNWLVVHARHAITNRHTDTDISDLFRGLQGRDHVLIEVKISPVEAEKPFARPADIRQMLLKAIHRLDGADRQEIELLYSRQLNPKDIADELSFMLDVGDIENFTRSSHSEHGYYRLTEQGRATLKNAPSMPQADAKHK